MKIIPKCLLLHDMASLGRCSLSAAIPVLSVMGIQCVPLPTAFLSAQTDGFEGFVFEDATRLFSPFREHWKREGIAFDAIYCGFLGSYRQFEETRELISDFGTNGCSVVIDPVMGDSGEIYKTYTESMCDGMRGLITHADYVTPNVTEAAILLGRDYSSFPDGKDLDGIGEWLAALGCLAPKSRFFITGVETLSEEGRETGIGVASLENGRPAVTLKPKISRSYPGTGDIFASCLTGALLNGKQPGEAAGIADGFVRRAIELSASSGLPEREGVLLEALLPALSRYNPFYSDGLDELMTGAPPARI